MQIRDVLERDGDSGARCVGGSCAAATADDVAPKLELTLKSLDIYADEGTNARVEWFQEADMEREKLPWRIWVLFAFLTLVILGTIVGNDGANLSAAASRTTTTSAEPRRTIDDANRAVDQSRHDAATSIAAKDAGSTRKRIANRLAQRVVAAVRAGDLGRAKALLIEAKDYPITTQMQRARARYRAAEARAARRARQRRAAEQRHREEAVKAAPQPKSTTNCDPNYAGACLDPTSVDYDCAGGNGNGPDYTGPVRSVGSDPFDLDRDHDGIGCEG